MKFAKTLSRDEMKKVMAGYSRGNCRQEDSCSHGCEEEQLGGGYLCSLCCVAHAKQFE